MNKYKCCLCGREFKGWGNNPWPLCDQDDYDSKCCDWCNSFVIEARMIQMNGEKITEADINRYKKVAKESIKEK